MLEINVGGHLSYTMTWEISLSLGQYLAILRMHMQHCLTKLSRNVDMHSEEL